MHALSMHIVWCTLAQIAILCKEVCHNLFWGPEADSNLAVLLSTLLLLRCLYFFFCMENFIIIEKEPNFLFLVIIIH